MTQPQLAQYGAWKSPITSDLIVSQTIGLGQIYLDGEDIYWVEGRPAEKGRNVIVRRTTDGQILNLLPSPYNARSLVHEYGGGAYLVNLRKIYFANFTDQRLYQQTDPSEPQPLTPATNWRYADGIIDQQRGRLICVREDHNTTAKEPVNTIVSINLLNGEDIQVLVAGEDFYSSPRLHPDGNQLCWLSWNHPNLPWDGTELWVGALNQDGSLGATHLVAGGVNESICQPEWSPDGILHLISDRTGWWNLYRWEPNQTIDLEPLAPMSAEFGRPGWVFGISNYGFASPDQIICTYTQSGIWHLASLNSRTKELVPIETPYTEISSVKVSGNTVVFLAGSPTQASLIAQLDLSTGTIQVLRQSSQLELNPGYLSIPQEITFPTTNGLIAHAIFYPPQNCDYIAPSGEKPPLLVKSHGGPTGSASSNFSLSTQYWTSRGIAVLDVNYGGSTGYGREYRQRLDGNWGIVDVDDCVNGAKYLAQQGLVDEARLAITGKSAGGYTTLCALAFSQVFRAGASHYGVSDLEALAQDTHKFESRYLDRLIGRLSRTTGYLCAAIANPRDRQFILSGNFLSRIRR